VPAYAVVPGRSHSHTESGGPDWATGYPRVDEFGELSGALLGQPRWSSVCRRAPQSIPPRGTAYDRSPLSMTRPR
jgi:hypothetical protein